jgi:hypothetical protein
MTNWEPFLFPKECLDIEDFEYSEIHYAYSEDGLKSFFGDHTHLVVEYDSVTILGWGALNFAIVDPTDDDLPQINLSASEYDGINPSPLINKPSAGPGTFPGGTVKLELSRVLAALVYPAGEGLIWSDELQTNIPRPYDAYNNPEGIDLGLIFNWGVGEIEVTKIYLEGGTKENPPEEPEPPVEPGDVLVTGIIFDDTDTDTNKKVVDELEIGETIQLSVIVLPEDAENKEVKWYSDRALVASVDDTGLVTGISDGFGVTITARTTDGGFLADCFIIQVGEGGEEPEPTPTPRPRYYDVNATEPDGSPVRNEIINANTDLIDDGDQFPIDLEQYDYKLGTLTGITISYQHIGLPSGWYGGGIFVNNTDLEEGMEIDENEYNDPTVAGSGWYAREFANPGPNESLKIIPGTFVYADNDKEYSPRQAGIEKWWHGGGVTGIRINTVTLEFTPGGPGPAALMQAAAVVAFDDDSDDDSTYVVGFDVNGGNPLRPKDEVSGVAGEDNKLESLPTPTRSGHNFLGWFTAASGGVKVTEDYTYNRRTDIYAQWEIIGGVITPTPIDPSPTPPGGGGNGGGGGGGVIFHSATRATSGGSTAGVTRNADSIRGNSVTINVTVRKDGTAIIALPAHKITEIINKTRDFKVTLDLSGIPSVTKVLIPTMAFNSFAKAGFTLEVGLPDGTVVFDRDAVASTGQLVWNRNATIFIDDGDARIFSSNRAIRNIGGSVSVK